ncbi:Acid phosphatase [hydrothermal vent metagenome]|uniref:Acid phosphatase n=1 Tax=hydrothermal vent metagenome TaxID=652676 RepID=A0A3B0UCP4_9ZZZZ
MKHILIATLALFFSLGLTLSPKETSHKQSIKLPTYSHIVIVIEENKDYDKVIGNAAAPYINNVLKKEGANFTQMYAEEHVSEGNYFWLFSGDDQGVGHFDVIPTKQNNKNYPFKTYNLGEQLIKNGYTFKGYSESLPAIGDAVSRVGYYARKHVPWVSFSNVPNGTSVESSSNLQFKQFPKDFNKLPTVSFVVPNLIHDMHNGKAPKSVKDGDDWLKENLNSYYQWAKSHNSLLVITFDENSDRTHYLGYTDPASKNISIRNRIPTIFAGAHIKPGNYTEGKGVTHVNILRTIEAMYGLQKCGHQQANALKFGISNDYVIKDVFFK